VDDWYTEWVRDHCTATGADASAARALLSEFVRGVLLDSGRTTPGELGEVTVRLLARRETPKFANEHSDAVGRELVRLREERRIALLGPPVAAAGDFAPDCPACGGSGLAVIPVRACVWDGRLVLHPDLKRVVTGAVICDRPGCPAGERVWQAEGLRKLDERSPRRPKLSQCERAVGGIDLPALVRDHERERAAAARVGMPPRPATPNLAAILAGVTLRAA
jgi:hypothetical protein